MKPVLVALLLLLAGFGYSQSASKSVEQDLTSKYRDKMFVLRSFYRTESLHFDPSGKLISVGETGYGPTDGSFHAVSFKVANNQLTIKGDLPVPIYDAKQDKLIFTQGYVKRDVVLDLADPTDTASVETALWNIFYRPGERPLPPCSAERAAGFREQALAALEHRAAPPPQTPPEGAFPPVSCFPNGESAPRVRFGPNANHLKITPPNAKYDPEPAYPEPARQKGLEGEVVLSMIVDSFGRPSTIVVVRPLGNGFDESAAKTVHSWRFEPARADGQPTPVAISVEVAFHLYRR